MAFVLLGKDGIKNTRHASNIKPIEAISSPVKTGRNWRFVSQKPYGGDRHGREFSRR